MPWYKTRMLISEVYVPKQSVTLQVLYVADVDGGAS
jgi:hypothetical protein